MSNKIQNHNVDHLISKFVQKIEGAYRRLGYSLGWRFLYGTPDTLVHSNGIILVGMNPGGEIFENPKPFLHRGNAYTVEANSWDKDGKNLAKQLIMFFGEISALPFCKSDTGEELLEGALVSNFCPFRSPTWEKLPKRKEATAFSKDLWRGIFRLVKPNLVLCMGKKTYSCFTGLALEADSLAQIEPEFKYPCGWGNLSFHVKQYRYQENPKLCLVIYLPHLSRYKLMSNPKCRSQVIGFIKRLKLIYERS